MPQATRRPAGRGDAAASLKPREHRGEVLRGTGPGHAFEPVLIEEGREGGLAQLDFPKDAQERRHRLLAFALLPESKGMALGPRAIAGVRAGAQPEFDAPAPLGRRELVMSNLV